MILRRLSLSSRLMGTFALLSLAGVVSTAGFTYYKAREALRASTVERLALSSHERGEAIHRWVRDKKREVESLASLPSFRSQAARLLHGSNAGTGLQASADSFDYLARMAASFPDFSELSLISASTGQVLQSTDPIRLGEFVNDERYFQEGRSVTFVQNPYSLPRTGGLAMTVATPVPASSGPPAEVLAARLRLDRLNDLIREPAGLERTAGVILVDRRNRPIAGKNLGVLSAAGGIRTVGVERALKGETGWALYRDHRAIQVIGFFRWLPALEMALVVEMDEADAFAPARDLWIRVTAGGILVAVLLSLTVRAVARRFARPVTALTEAAKEVEQGNLDVVVPEGGGDEMGTLGSAFNRMTAHLKDLYDALRESERSYREIFDATNDSILIHEASTGAILDANRAATLLLGHSRGELLLLTLDDLSALGAEGGDELRRLIGRAVHVGPQRFEWLALRGDGREIWAEVILSASDIGGKGRVLSSARDITRRKVAEAEVVRHRDRLEELVRERTGALEEAQEALLKKERFAVMGHLIATVSHELRNPLGTVRNCIYSIGEAVRRGEPGGVSRSLLLAERNIRRCGSIIDELLDYSRNRAVQPVAVELDPFVKVMLGEQMLSEGISMAVELASGATVSVDPILFRRCFQNVVENALQAMEGAGGSGHRLEVASSVEGGRVELRVSDTGPGIAPELRARVFEPLFSTKPTGVGLGLPLVKDVMEKHLGGVEIRNAPGGGATMVLWLPL